MTDLPKELANKEVVNPFVSLKKILEDINRDSIGELVTEIETNGIFAYDDIDRLRKYTVENGTKAAQAIELIEKFYNYDPYYYQDRGINEYVLSPLDSVQNPEWHIFPNLPDVPSDYNYYGWLKNDLPDFCSIEPNQIEISDANQEPVKVTKSIIVNEPTHDPLNLEGIALLFVLNADANENKEIWKSLAKNAKRNGLAVARKETGKGKGQSVFDQVEVGEWLVKKGKMDQARVNRLLGGSLPTRNAHLKDLFNA